MNLVTRWFLWQRLVLNFVFIMKTTSIHRNSTQETELLKYLFGNYSSEAHPISDNKARRTVLVKFDAQVIRILQLHEIDQTIEVYTWINQYWRDPQLTWEPKDFGGIKSIYITGSKIWTPDIVLYNNVGQKSKQLGDAEGSSGKIKVSHDGSISWLSPAVLRSICRIDVSHFPFDDQCCTLKFGSWSFDASRIDMIATGNLESINDYYIPNGEWELLSIRAQRNELYYQCCKEPFVDISIYLRLRRQALNYCLNLIVPCALLSSLVVLGYILPPESGERIGLTVALLLSVTVFQQLSNQFMPSYDFPFLAQYYWATIIQTGLSLVVTTVILNCYHRNHRKMHWLVRKILFDYVYQLLFCKKKEYLCYDSDNDEIDDDFIYALVPPETPKQKKEMNGMVAFNMNGRSLSAPDGHRRTSALSDTFPLKGLRLESSIPTNTSLSPMSARSTSFAPQGTTPTSNSQSRSKKRKKILERRKKEWLKAARILDRLFMVLSMVTFFLTAICVFVRAPRFIGQEPQDVCVM